jgi:hypothetical protein
MDLWLESPMKVNADIVILVKVLFSPNQSFLKRVRLLEYVRIIAFRLNFRHIMNVEDVGNCSYDDNKASKFVNYLAKDLIKEFLS